MTVQLSDKLEYVDYADVTVEALFLFSSSFLYALNFFFPFSSFYCGSGSFLLKSITGLGIISLTET